MGKCKRYMKIFMFKSPHLFSPCSFGFLEPITASSLMHWLRMEVIRNHVRTLLAHRMKIVSLFIARKTTLGTIPSWDMPTGVY